MPWTRHDIGALHISPIRGNDHTNRSLFEKQGVTKLRHSLRE